MNNIEELNNKARIERLKSKFEIAKSYGSDQLTVPMPDLEALIAQLEAAQKESAIRLEAIEQMRKTVAHNVERAQTAEAALSAENEKLKGYQVPVGLIKRKTPLLSDGAFRYSFISDVNLPFDTELFTAPQKLSDLPYDIVFNAIAKATNIQGQAISISVKEFKAAIKAAGGTVEE